MGYDTSVYDAIGFPEFHEDAFQELGPQLTAARTFLQLGQGMMNNPVSGQLPNLVKQITQTVANSMESVLLLTSNGCGVDALKIARTMFEAAVILHYLDEHPGLAQDFIDFLWVKRKKHYDYLLKSDVVNANRIPPEKVTEVLENYERVRPRFTDKKGRVRNSWCKASLREMATEVKAESMYGGIYPFGSSMMHSDVLAIVAGAGASGDVEPVPSKANLTGALRMALLSFAMALMAFDKIASLGRGDIIVAALTQLRNSSGVA